ncbi:unnamed protein product [Phaedon cochleariae]|uniref:Uncharacterized protein n=1 Tax=Phaedon cochleariae TaxID=80249 RepID=A0A9P0DUY5_PHACE|nr:unnamed protein product [Phaedon cochleariae]
MKYTLLVCCALWQLAQCKTLPDYLKQYSCSKSDPNYTKCILESFEDSKQHFLNGIPELNFPPFDPFLLPIMSVNRTINDLVSINAICKNINVTGFRNTILDDLKADPQKHTGEIRLTVPWMFLDMDYEVLGQLLIVPLQSSGHFQGNFTDTQMFVKGSLKTYKRKGVDYFKVNKLNAKITIGGGHVQLTSSDKEYQYAADLISDFFNENPRRVLDAVNPIFIEYANELFAAVADQTLAALPASEWLPA